MFSFIFIKGDACLQCNTYHLLPRKPKEKLRQTGPPSFPGDAETMETKCELA